MRRFLPLSAVLLAAGCVGVGLRYSPSLPAYPLAPERVAPIASVEFADLAGGLREEGTPLVLKRPFVDDFRDAVLAQLAALKVPVGTAGGAAVRVEVTEATLARGRGFKADLTATVKYRLRVVRDGRESCVKDVSGWAVVREGFATSPAAAAMERGLAKAVDNLGPALASSCLYPPAAAVPGAASVPPPAVPRDPALIAVVIGAERHRAGVPAADGAARDAREFADQLKALHGLGDDRVAVLLDEGASLADLNKNLERWLPDHAAPGDRVVVYFAGHGARDAGGEPYLVPFDGDPAYLDSTAFPVERLLKGLGHLPAAVVVVLDASFAGEGGRTLAGPRPSRARPLMDAAPPSNVTVFVAASEDRAARSAEGRGVFTAALLRALRERSGDFSAAFDAAAAELAGQKPLRRVGR